MRLVRVVLVLAVALLMVCPVLAQEKEKKKGRRGGPQGGAAIVNRLLEGLTLTDEQKSKIADVNKECDAKVAEAQKKIESLLTDENKKARADAQKEAKEAGKSPRDAFRAVEEAMKLTDEQKSKRAEIRKEIGGVERQRREKVMDTLTSDQKEQVQKKIEEFKKREGGKKKRDQ